MSGGIDDAAVCMCGEPWSMHDDLGGACPVVGGGTFAHAVAVSDSPQWDATDFAHPAWWRGHDHGAEGVVRALNGVMDGPADTVHHFGSVELGKLAARIQALRSVAAAAPAALVLALGALLSGVSV